MAPRIHVELQNGDTLFIDLRPSQVRHDISEFEISCVQSQLRGARETLEQRQSQLARARAELADPALLEAAPFPELGETLEEVGALEFEIRARREQLAVSLEKLSPAAWAIAARRFAEAEPDSTIGQQASSILECLARRVPLARNVALLEAIPPDASMDSLRRELENAPNELARLDGTINATVEEIRRSVSSDEETRDRFLARSANLLGDRSGTAFRELLDRRAVLQTRLRDLQGQKTEARSRALHQIEHELIPRLLEEMPARKQRILELEARLKSLESSGSFRLLETRYEPEADGR